ncbi:MAG: phosphoribosyltransferase [Deltaproteobacteria bacterium]|nr:phosphoribosyltransferase [Deltaproteobacteria bacterium]
MHTAEVLSILHEVGAVLTESHFVYTSGKHGAAYVNKDAIYPHTGHVARLCEALATPFATAAVDTVAGPAVGGVILAQWTARHLSQMSGREVVACFAEERVAEDGAKTRYFGRGYERFITGKRVLIVEDILTTGGSAKQVVEAVRACGGEAVAVSALCNRGDVRPADIGDIPLNALIALTLQAWDAADCPMCKRGVPINTTVGKGKSLSKL